MKNTAHAIAIMVLVAAATSLAAEQPDFMDEIGAKVLRAEYIKACNSDKACERDVKTQFHPCLRKSDFL